MSDSSVEIIKLLSVTLTREKQDILNPELKRYAAATNFAIKTIFSKKIPDKTQAHELLHDELVNKYVFVSKDGQPGDSVSFGRRFKYATIIKHIPERVKTKTNQGIREVQRTPEELRNLFSSTIANQYADDVLKTAAVEITRYRKLAKNLVSIRGKVPHFKEGVIIGSGFIIDVGAKALDLLTLTGDTLPIPFDKRSRNREIDTLTEIAGKKRKFDRVRLTWNKEGFLNVDIRLPKT
jgi:hypothetical protein